MSATDVESWNLARPVFEAAHQHPEATALLGREGTLAYGALSERIRHLAGALAHLGMEPGDRVALLMYNTPAWVISYFALLGLGLVVIPLNTRLTSHEIETILKDAQARVLLSAMDFAEVLTQLKVSSLEAMVVDTSLLEGDEETLDAWLHRIPNEMAFYRMEELLERRIEVYEDEEFPFPRQMKAEDMAALIYTSGTTGVPKGVMLSHKNILSDARANALVIEATAGDRFITISPLFHVFGQTNILVTAMRAGASVVLVRKFSPRGVLEAIARYGVTFMAAVPTMYLMMLSHLREKSFDLSSLRVCHSGAAPMAVETFHEVEKHFGAHVQEGYGLSEASSIVCSNPLHGTRKPGSVGLPLDGVDIRILDDEKRELPSDEIGELYIAGDIVMLGYYERPEETAKTLFEIDGRTWLKTKDLGYKDTDGYLYIVDRADDLINIGGVKVYPREIEEVLYKHPGVQACAVTGVPSTLHHEAIKAFIVLKPGTQNCDKETLMAFCKDFLAEFKIPKFYDFVDEIPQGATGKILRKELRKRADVE